MEDKGSMKMLRTVLALFAAAAVPLAMYMSQRQQRARTPLQRLTQTARERASGVSSSVHDVAGPARETLGSVASTTVDTVSSLAERARGTLAPLASSGGDTLSTAAGSARETVAAATRRARKTAGSAASGGQGSLSSAGDTARERSASLVETAGKVAGRAGTVLAAAPRVVARVRHGDEEDRNPYGGGEDWRNYGKVFED